MVDPSLDFSGRGRALKGDPTGLDFVAKARKSLKPSKTNSPVESSLDFVAQGRGKQNGGGIKMIDPSLNFVAQGRQQTANISKMVEKSTGVPMVESIITTTTGTGKKKKTVTEKKFSKPKEQEKKTIGNTDIDLKKIVAGIKKFNQKGESFGKSLRRGKKKEAKTTRSEMALDRILERSQVKPRTQEDLSADKLTQRRLRQLIDEEKAKRSTVKGILSRLRGRK